MMTFVSPLTLPQRDMEVTQRCAVLYCEQETADDRLEDEKEVQQRKKKKKVTSTVPLDGWAPTVIRRQ